MNRSTLYVRPIYKKFAKSEAANQETTLQKFVEDAIYLQLSKNQREEINKAEI